jgi:hypothetical protein
MNHHKAIFGMEQWAKPKPVEQFFGVGRGQDGLQGVFSTRLGNLAPQREKMDIVIS